MVLVEQQLLNATCVTAMCQWSKPIWVFRGETQIYIAQETGIEAAITKVKIQHPQETEQLEVITVGGILAPDQAIFLNTNLL